LRRAECPWWYAYLSFRVRGGDSKRAGELVQARGSVMKKPPRTLARPSQNRIGTGTEKPTAIAKKPPMSSEFFMKLLGSEWLSKLPFDRLNGRMSDRGVFADAGASRPEI
jgi:hypothetical protein